VTTLEWLAIGEALTSAPTTRTGQPAPLHSLFEPLLITTPQAMQQLLVCLGGQGPGVGGLGGGSGWEVMEAKGWHCLDEGAAPVVMAAALWDGGAGVAQLAVAAGGGEEVCGGGRGPAAAAAGADTANTAQSPPTAAPGAAAVSGGAAVAGPGAVAIGIEDPRGWPGVVYLPSPGDAAPGATLVTLAAAWHAAMGASSTPYTCARGR
jgi:hypothetical protein